MAEHVVEPPQPRSPLLHLAPVRAPGRADGQGDPLPPQGAEDGPDAAQLLEPVEDQPDPATDLLIGVEVQSTRRQPHVAERRPDEQLAALGLVELASFQPAAHGHELDFADHPLQAQKEPVVGIARVVDPVLIRQQDPEDGADIEEVMPVLMGPGQPAHLQPQDEADVVQGHLGDQPLEPGAAVRAPATLPLVVIDDQHPLRRPAEGHGPVDQAVLTRRRFPVVKHLLG